MSTLNTNLFKQMLQNASNNLLNNRERIDALNVFPVPDGDTGTNMSLTFSAGVKSALGANDDTMEGISKSLSKGLLMGARGNSGVILSQIFRGVSQGLEGIGEEATVMQLADAFVRGSEIAYRAVMKPVEGTILTVIRESSYNAKLKVEENPEMSVSEFFTMFLAEANESLEYTPELLPVLKEVGVVDSGGAGLVAIIEGFKLMLDGVVVEHDDSDVSSEVVGGAAGATDHDEFGYCTEFIIRIDEDAQHKFNEEKMRASLSVQGNSIVMVTDDDLVKVHVHTLKPGDVLNMAQRYGEFVKLKIENMQEQHDHLAIVQPEDEVSTEKEDYALIAVAAGEGLTEYFKELRVKKVISGGQTMNPSTEDFVAAIEKINAENIIILPNNSNIVLAAQQVKEIITDKNIEVVETKSIVQGISACINFNPEDNLENNIENMTAAIADVKTGEITNAIKDTQYEGIPIHKDDFMGIAGGKIVVSDKDFHRATVELIKNMVDEDNELVTLIVGENVDETLVTSLENFIEDEYDVECETIQGDQPVYHFIIGVE